MNNLIPINYVELVTSSSAGLDFCSFLEVPESVAFANQSFLGQKHLLVHLGFSLSQSHSSTELSWTTGIAQTEKGPSGDTEQSLSQGQVKWRIF